MKKILLLICVLFCFVAVADAGPGYKIVGSGVPAAATCSSVVSGYSNTGATIGDYDITDAAAYYYVGHHFITVAETTNICGATFYLTLGGGTITGKTYTAYIYTNDGSGNLVTLVGTSNGVTGSQAWSDTAVTFSFSPAVELTSGNNYAVVVSTGTVDDTGNFAEMEYATGAITGLIGRWGSDLTRTGSTSGDMKIVLYE